MSDQEVIKHTEKVIHIVSDKHNWSEHRNEQKVTRTFLWGLKGDIQEDITETKELLRDFEVGDTIISTIDKMYPEKR